MQKEIELKFLLNQDKKILGELLNSYNIEQGYLSNGKNHVTRVRLRRNLKNKHQEGFLTIKSTGDGISRDEFEYDIPFSDAQSMIKDAEHSLSKTRDIIALDGLFFEVDHFLGSLAGLAFVEVEFNSEKEALSFDSTKYDFLGKDVSRDKAYSNHTLSQRKINHIVNVKYDFSSRPFGRYPSDGDNSGERFRDDFLLPELKYSSAKTVLNFEGLTGSLSSGFLEESFGGLVREHKAHPLEIFSKLSFINIESEILANILEYVLDMSCFSIINKEMPKSYNNLGTTVHFIIDDNKDLIYFIDKDISKIECCIMLMDHVYKKYGIVDSIKIENIIK
jgi:adenylate cyclase